eukprot:7375906-Pyramimonas_sp.AAC.1
MAGGRIQDGPRCERCPGDQTRRPQSDLEVAGAQHHCRKRAWKGFQHDLKTTRTRHTFAGLGPAAGSSGSHFSWVGCMVGWIRTILLKGELLANNPAETTQEEYLARLLPGEGGPTHPSPQPHRGRCQEGCDVGERAMPSGQIQ